MILLIVLGVLHIVLVVLAMIVWKSSYVKMYRKRVIGLSLVPLIGPAILIMITYVIYFHDQEYRESLKDIDSPA